jgi:hypothetical protein
MKPGTRLAVLKRSLSLGSAFGLLFFLAASAPHRVHHIFERFPVAQNLSGAHEGTHDHATHHEHHREPAPSSQQRDCVVLSVAQHSHLSAVESFEIRLIDTLISPHDQPTFLVTHLLHFSPGSPRAPPQLAGSRFTLHNLEV